MFRKILILVFKLAHGRLAHALSFLLHLFSALKVRRHPAVGCRSDGAAPVAGTQPTSDAGAGDLDARLRELTTRDPVVLFMKGDRGEPRCGFSRKVVEALNGTGVEYSTFDILQDEDVRQGLKTFSNWPTYPQLYAGGELLGGCDIVLEMAAGGELKAALGA